MARATIRTRRPARPTDRRCRGPETASALVLVPSMMLVLLCLGGIAVDLSLVHGAHRSAHRVVTAAADDAAAMIDTEALQLTGDLRIDPAAARRVALAQLATMSLPGDVVGSPTVDVDADGSTVTVTVTLVVDHVMLRAVPGHPRSQQLTVVARGRLNR